MVGVISVEEGVEMALEVGLDLVEVSPDYDPSTSTSTLAAQLLLNIIGRILYHKN